MAKKIKKESIESMSDNTDEKVSEFLEKSFDRVNNWLQFAETKHAALIAFLVAILAILYGENFIDNIILQAIIAVIYVIALLISICSFYPRYNKDTSKQNGNYEKADNLLFWKDIAKYSEIDFLKKIYKDFFEIDKKTFKVAEKSMHRKLFQMQELQR